MPGLENGWTAHTESTTSPNTEFSESDIAQVLKPLRQRGVISDIGERLQALKALRKFLTDLEDVFIETLASDLHRHRQETVTLETQVVLFECNKAIKNLHAWSSRRPVSTPCVALPGSAFVEPIPKGVVLIIAPFNYPVQLSLVVLVSAIAAGNTCVLKLSELTPETSLAIATHINDYLPKDIVGVVLGGPQTGSLLLKEKFDHIFFTGSERVGKIVMKAAAEHLTPVTLELGGKSPCVIFPSTNIALAAKRIMWTKWANAGQTCIAGDYALVHESVYDEFINACRFAVEQFVDGKNAQNSPDYCRIINKVNTTRLKGLLDDCRDKILFGGDVDVNAQFVAPTLVGPVAKSNALMKSEIFGPILPVMTFDSISDAVDIINDICPTPLALYVFGTTQEMDGVLSKVKSGGACINDCVFQFTLPEAPFGGIGTSGMGAYHGQSGFDELSHLRPVLVRSAKSLFDLPQRYPPYKQSSENLIKTVLHWTNVNSSSLSATFKFAVLTGILAAAVKAAI